MSLEMVIGLLILLVVAAVVIKLFLNSVTPLSNIGDISKSRQYQEFKDQCKVLCDQFTATNTRAAAAKYCSYKFKGVSNLKQDLLNKPLDSDTKTGLSVCPDAIYCFHAQQCQTDSGTIDWGDCRSILCQAYYDTYGDYGKASQKVSEIIPNSGNCNLPKSENWFTLFGFGPDPPCGGVVSTTATTTTSSSTASVTCSKTSDTSVTCTWSCPNDNISGTIAISGTNQAVSFTSKTGSQLFTGLAAGTRYNIGLVCDIPDAKLVGSYSITI